MNVNLPFLPERSAKPRKKGVTMMMDKGLSLKETENFIESSGHLTDIVKFGFGTSVITNNLKEKIKLYKEGGMIPYFGGTLFEAFIVRDMFDEYLKYITSFGLEMAEVSDGSLAMDHDEKLGYIEKLAKEVTVLSEVGSKQKGIVLSADEWVKQMSSELKAGSWKVIAEARESGTVGIYNADGSTNVQLIDHINRNIKAEDIMWEAPDGKQQIWFIKTYGPEVNLGNIAPNIVIPLECLRLGLRGDTFFDYLPQEVKEGKLQLPSIVTETDYQI